MKYPPIPPLRGARGGVRELCDLSERSEAGGELISARYKPLADQAHSNPRNTQCIPPVRIFAFLELESRF